MAFVTFPSSSQRNWAFAAPQFPHTCSVDPPQPSLWSLLHSGGDDRADERYQTSLSFPSSSHALARATYERQLQADQARQVRAARAYRQRMVEKQRIVQRQRQQQLQQLREAQQLRRERLAAAIRRQQQQQEHNARTRARRELARQWEQHQLRERNEREAARYESAFQPDSVRETASNPAAVTTTRVRRRVHRDGSVEEVYIRQIGDQVQTACRTYNPRTLTWETAEPQRLAAAAQLPSSAHYSSDDEDCKSDSGSNSSPSTSQHDRDTLHSLMSLSPLSHEPTDGAPQDASAPADTESRPGTPELDLTGDTDTETDLPHVANSPSSESGRSASSGGRSASPSSLVEIRDLTLDGFDSDDSDVEIKDPSAPRSRPFALEDEWDEL